MNSILISVIIPTCDRNDFLRKCLASLASTRQSLDLGEYEVIVSDDSQSGSSRKVVEEEFFWVKWFAGPKKGPAANRNNGAKEALGEWLLFIDDDCVSDENLLPNYKQVIIDNPQEEAFEGKIVPDDWSLLNKDLSECPINIDGNCFWSANICVKKSIFVKVHGFDEDYLIAAHEDQQLKHDIESIMKHKVFFAHDCQVTHPVRFTTLKKKIRNIPVVSKNFAIYSVKNRKLLHNDSKLEFLINEITFHSRMTIQLIRSKKIKGVVLSLAYMFYAVPLNFINYNTLLKIYKPRHY